MTAPDRVAVVLNPHGHLLKIMPSGDPDELWLYLPAEGLTSPARVRATRRGTILGVDVFVVVEAYEEPGLLGLPVTTTDVPEVEL